MKKSIVLFLLATGALFAQPEGADHMSHLQNLDSDGDGEITQAEFLAGAEKHFAALDANGDGILTSDEIRSVRHTRRAERHLKMMGSHLLLRADADEDGLVTGAEWGDYVAGLETDEDGSIVLGRMRRQPRGEEGNKPLDFNENGIVDSDDLNQLFANFDANGDQVLDDTELVQHHGRRARGGKAGGKRGFRH